MSSAIRVLVGDSHPIFCQGVKDTFAYSQDISLVGSVTCYTQLLLTCQECRPNIVLLSSNIGSPLCLEVVNEINRLSFTPKILCLLSKLDDASVHWFIQHGVAGLFLKSDPPEKLLEAILTISQGEPWLSSRFLSAFINKPLDKPGWDLNEQDLAVLHLIVAGKCNKEIAHALHICERAVGNHLAKIYTSLAVKSRAAAAAQAIRLNLVE